MDSADESESNMWVPGAYCLDTKSRCGATGCDDDDGCDALLFSFNNYFILP